MKQDPISIKKACIHNLQSVSVELAPNELIVFTGVSGSGKSSLAFDTIHVEGQRRYVESLPNHAKRYLGQMPKPEAESLSGISPTISIEQKAAGNNPRSTVGTMTEIYDYLRILYARIGTPYCPISGEAVMPQSRERIIRTVQTLPEGKKILVLSPFAQDKKAEFKEEFQLLLRRGFLRARVDGKIVRLDEDLDLDGSLAHDVDVVIDRIKVDKSSHSRLAEAVTQALEMSQGLCIIMDVETEEEELYSMHAFSPKSGLSYSSLDPNDFSFNSPTGMCDECSGLGVTNTFDLNLIIDSDKSIAEDCCSIASSASTVRFGNIYRNLAEIYGFDLHTPWKKLPKKAKDVFLYGINKKWVRMHFIHPEKGNEWTDYVAWKGVIYDAKKRYSEASSHHYRKRMDKLMSEQQCSQCLGSRLKPYPRNVQLGKKIISEISAYSIQEAADYIDSLKLTDQELLIGQELIREIRQRLQFLLDVGLHYLTLDRTAPSLSGGEAQRVRLASQIGCGLVGVTYILDEPSIGLHPRDNTKLLHTLCQLRDKGNTVIVVEHDEETILQADRVVDFGPGAGTEGGKVLVNGSIKQLLACKQSATGAYLSGRKKIAIPKKRRKGSGNCIELKGASHHNLKQANVKIPLGTFVAVTGVSGSGKSSLISDTLHPCLVNALHKGELPVGAHKSIKGIEHIDKVIGIDQSPIGRNPRSNPGTYIKLFDDIRDLFTQLPESKARGYKAGRFSFNVKEGSCTRCGGMGQIKIDMDFMEDAWLACPLCKMKRFDNETLSVLYKQKNIHEILEMPIARALEFFEAIPQIRKKLEVLNRVGLGYLTIGQASTTLSGGEAQRIKLAKELVRPQTGNTLYILDEPTTGLHFQDIHHLLTVLNELVELGNTVLVIEHNMDVVKTADWVIDLGPEGGAYGGQIVAQGKPESIAKKDTPTGKAIREALKGPALQSITKKEKPPRKKALNSISIRSAEQNNLKRIDLEIPRNKMTVCTGPSGSGKSSLAFETIFAEGQRRYTESLSPYARQFVKQMPKPKVEQIEGLSPAIAIEQKAHAGNPRSTVGTMTEVYDSLRVLYARSGTAYCPETGEKIEAISKDHVVERVMAFPEKSRLHVLAPLQFKRQDDFSDLIRRLQRQGYLRIRLNGEIYELDQEISFDRRRRNQIELVVDRLVLNPNSRHRLLEAVEHAAELGEQQILILENEKEHRYNLAFSVLSTGKSYPEITPKSFAFNTAAGMCPDCQGLGYQYGADLRSDPDLMQLSCIGILYRFWGYTKDELIYEFSDYFKKAWDIDPESRLCELSTKQLRYFLYGAPEKEVFKLKKRIEFRWIGMNNALERIARGGHRHHRQAIQGLLNEIECYACQGSRLNPLARHVKLNGIGLGELCHMPVEEALVFLQKLKLPKNDQKLLEEILEQSIQRLQFLCRIGLGYLSLDRNAPSLSGGEAQRIRLARQLGTQLRGVLYVLDEPTTGLHPRDNQLLNDALQELKAIGNTLVLVEHDPLTVQHADRIIDFGPGAGKHGGHVSSQGTYKQILKNKNSLTGQYLSGKKSIQYIAPKLKDHSDRIRIENASLNNLSGFSVDIPLHKITSVTGVSGSGKSTLVHKILAPGINQGLHQSNTVSIGDTIVQGAKYFQRILTVDQNPIGHTSRSTVASYTDVLTPLRQLFAKLPDAKIRGLEAKHFSYNHKKGMCSHCWGMGYRKIEMHFLPTVRVTCEECQGLRLNPLSLEVHYIQKNLGQILQYTVEECYQEFANHRAIMNRLDTLMSVGLGYLKLGQEIATLSGGEAQRLKLSRELSKRGRGHTLYLLDEPTTGLHSDDINKLMKVLYTLRDKGNTLVVIEHNIDVIQCSDHIIDLGPGAGKNGGQLIATGTPSELSAIQGSVTGQYLKS